MHPTPIVLASRNPKKLREMATLLAFPGWKWLSVAELDGIPEVEETGTTFAENSALKACTVARAAGMWAVADDSGIEVEYLQGAPGVYSARYAGPDATDKANCDKLLEELAGVPPEKRGARFVCHLTLADPEGKVRATTEGFCRGVIVQGERGGEGFGYDPLFLLPEYHRTFGELSPNVKRVLSHRARAAARLSPYLDQLARSNASAR
jgi:XTP/dITP diphosphohydrolase